MVRSEIDKLDASPYCFDTGLTFGADFGREVLKLAKSNIQAFPQRRNYKAVHEPKEMVRLIGKQKTRELLRRVEQQRALFPGDDIQFTQHYLPDDLASKALEVAPDWLKDLALGEPSPILQVSQGGARLSTHKGHKRIASLFMLLQGSGQETRWYRDTEDFEVIDPLRIPDHDKIEHVVTAVLQPFRWYVFNHSAWHSVHNFCGDVRINLGLDFQNVDAQTLVKACRDCCKSRPT